MFQEKNRMMRTVIVGLLTLGFLLSPPSLVTRHVSRAADASLAAGESHLGNIRQLTAGLQNAEAYFSFDGSRLIFQSTHDFKDGASGLEPTPDDKGLGCYQMYVMDVEGRNIRRVSPGRGATTCGYFFPGDRRVLYSSTHLAGPHCPPKPQRGERYRWALDDYDIFANSLDGQRIQRLTATSGYDAEATVSPDGKTIVFTSMRDGDLDLYAMNLDGTHVRRLTREVGYDGGGFFSPDSRRIVYRAHHPQTADEVDEYRKMLAQNLVEPSRLEIYVMNADGTGVRQVTNNGASNFAPFFHPDGRRIIFASNVGDKTGPFHLYLINDDGTGLEQVTMEGSFNSFPMFAPDGKTLVWISNRNTQSRGEFNVFLADWIP
jgi:Tol biopolymer transport system component